MTRFDGFKAINLALAYQSASVGVVLNVFHSLYAQTTNVNRTTNLFKVVAFTGRSASITGAIIAFSLFAYLSLFGFFFVERVMKKSQ